jgi:hypothetical protein
VDPFLLDSGEEAQQGEKQRLLDRGRAHHDDHDGPAQLGQAPGKPVDMVRGRWEVWVG